MPVFSPSPLCQQPHTTNRKEWTLYEHTTSQVPAQSPCKLKKYKGANNINSFWPLGCQLLLPLGSPPVTSPPRSLEEQGNLELRVSHQTSHMGCLSMWYSTWQIKGDSLQAPVLLCLDRPEGCHDAKLTLYQLTLTLIFCQLNQGFPCGARCSAVCACECLCCALVVTGWFAGRTAWICKERHFCLLHVREVSWCVPGAFWPDGVGRFLSSLPCVYTRNQVLLHHS